MINYFVKEKKDSDLEKPFERKKLVLGAFSVCDCVISVCVCVVQAKMSISGSVPNSGDKHSMM